MSGGVRWIRCPHCGTRLAGARFGVPLGPTQVRIVDAVIRTGADGIARADLVELIYGDRRVRREAISVHINQINAALALRTDFQIESSKGKYARYRMRARPKEAA